jgi:aspartate beta-hydroxylase/beta-hydroxylase
VQEFRKSSEGVSLEPIAFVLIRLSAINGLFYRCAGGKDRPVFHDIQKTCPELSRLQEIYPIIRQEVEGLLAAGISIPRYGDLDRAQHVISEGRDPSKNWKIFVFNALGEKPEMSRRLCPRTAAILDEIPDVYQAFFSILDPGKSVPAHCAPYLGYLRYHLALKVPATNPPSIRIKDQHYTWKEGESILFDDSWEHEVYNCSDDLRVVLIVDVFRPMPFFARQVNRLAYLIGRFTYGKMIMKNLKPTQPLRG